MKYFRSNSLFLTAKIVFAFLALALIGLSAIFLLLKIKTVLLPDLRNQKEVDTFNIKSF